MLWRQQAHQLPHLPLPQQAALIAAHVVHVASLSLALHLLTTASRSGQQQSQQQHRRAAAMAVILTQGDGMMPNFHFHFRFAALPAGAGLTVHACVPVQVRTTPGCSSEAGRYRVSKGLPGHSTLIPAALAAIRARSPLCRRLLLNPPPPRCTRVESEMIMFMFANLEIGMECSLQPSSDRRHVG